MSISGQKLKWSMHPAWHIAHGTRLMRSLWPRKLYMCLLRTFDQMLDPSCRHYPVMAAQVYIDYLIEYRMCLSSWKMC